MPNDMKMRLIQTLIDARRFIVSVSTEHEHTAIEGRVVRVTRREIQQIDSALVDLQNVPRIPVPVAGGRQRSREAESYLLK